MINKESKIYIAGHHGMVGSACWRVFENDGYYNLIGKSSKELDLRDQRMVNAFISEEKPDLLIVAAAKVGGILANNSYPYEFLMENMIMQNNLINSAHQNDIKKLIFLGSSCIYPKNAIQPLKEEYLLTGPLESTNEWYAIAKISGIKAIESLRNQYNRDYVALMPTNLYGPNDNFDLNSSHVLPAMIRKFHEAKIKNNIDVVLWGSGTPFREFLHVDDLAKAVLLMSKINAEDHLYNVGAGTDISIRDLASSIQKIINHKGEIKWDLSKPDGTPKKLMDSSKIRELGWKDSINLLEGIKITYDWFVHQSRLG